MIFEARRLKFCVKDPIKNGIGAPAEHDDPAWPRYVRITDIQDARKLRDDTFRSLPPEMAEEAQFYVGDILGAAVGATFGKTYLHTIDTGPMAFAGYLVRISPTKDFDPRYVAYWTESQEYWNQVKSNVIQATIQNFSASKFADLRIPAPRRSVQIAISDFLDRETARLDGLIAEKERMLGLLEEKRTALISRVVTRGLDPAAPLKPSGQEWLGEIPAHWEIQPIKYLADVGNGSTPSVENAEYWDDEGYPWLNSSVVNTSPVKDASRFVTETALRDCHLPKIQPPAVLVGITGQGKTRGMAAILAIEATINQHIAFIKPRSKALDTEYLFYLLEHAYAVLRSDSDGAGSTKGAITCEQLANMKIPVPPSSEQIDVCARIRQSLDVSKPLRSQIQSSIDLMIERRSALITAAVAGEIPLDEMTT